MILNNSPWMYSLKIQTRLGDFFLINFKIFVCLFCFRLLVKFLVFGILAFHYVIASLIFLLETKNKKMFLHFVSMNGSTIALCICFLAIIFFAFAFESSLVSLHLYMVFLAMRFSLLVKVFEGKFFY